MGASILAVPTTGNALTATSGQLHAYWKLDETSGTRMDEVGDEDLTDNNTVSYRTGVIGNAADFTTANSEYLSRLSVNTDLDWTQSSWTHNAWVYWDSVNNTCTNTFGHYIVKFDHTGSYNGFYPASVGNSNDFYIYGAINGTAVEKSYTSSDISAGSWIMLTWTWDGDLLKLYKNGSLNESYDTTPDGTFDTSTSNLYIGAGWYGGLQCYLDGAVDEMSYWNTALSADDVSALYNAGTGLAYANLFGSTSTTSTSTATSTALDVETLQWTIELYLSLFTFMLFTYVGYRFTRMFL